MGSHKIGPKEKLRFVTRLADQKKAEDVVVLDLRKLANFCDYFFICSANSDRQVKSIADEIESGFSKKKIKVLNSNRKKYGLWALLDYGDLVVHVFEKETREFYNLERLWIDAPRVSLPTD